MPTSRYNPFRYIISDFRETFIDHRYRDNRINNTDFALFWIVPILLPILAYFLKLTLTTNLINVLLIALSIFAALLFNLLLLIYDISHKFRNSFNKEDELTRNGVDPKILHIYIRDTFSAISISLLISICAIVFLIFASLGIEYIPFKIILELIIYYLVAVFIFSLFLNLRRIYVLLQYEIESKQ